MKPLCEVAQCSPYKPQTHTLCITSSVSSWVRTSLDVEIDVSNRRRIHRQNQTNCRTIDIKLASNSQLKAALSILANKIDVDLLLKGRITNYTNYVQRPPMCKNDIDSVSKGRITDYTLIAFDVHPVCKTDVE